MHEDALACAIARLHFGEVVGTVTRVLLEHPGLSLLELARRTDGFGTRATRDALCVLLAHGAATATDGRDGGEVYRVEEGALLARTRLPLYLGLAQRRFGELGRAVLEILFARGRLTAHHLFTLALEEPMKELGVSDAAAAQCLADMARAGLLRWAGSRALGGARVVYGTGKRARDDSGDSEDDAHEPPPTGLDGVRVGVGFNSRLVGAPSRNNDDDVWAVSFWFLNRCFRNEACKIVIANRVDDALAVEVLITGLNIALSREDALSPTDDMETSEIPTDAVHQQLRNNKHEISARDFWNAIRTLVELDPPCVKAIPENAPTKLKFIPGRLVAEVREQTLEDLIVQRYKKIGRRIFRALAIDGCMEDKLIAEKCMLDVKVVREKLFCMHRDKLVTMQEVPRSHEAQRANNWYYLWRVRLQDAYKCFLGVMCKTQLNILLKLEALDKMAAVAEDETLVNVRQTQKKLLMASVIRVDQSIMVMRDFGPLTASYFPSRFKCSELAGRRRGGIR